jgi:putative ABC transport system substrate-binding protein
MRRRDALRWLGGVALAHVSPAALPQAARVPRIGLLGSTSEPEWANFVTGLRDGLRGMGFVEGSTVAIEYRWAESRFDRLPALAAELVSGNVSVIVTTGGAVAARAAKAATATVPVVFVFGGDPVRLGFVESLSKPGGNVTGVSFLLNALIGKRLALVRELLPQAVKVGLLVNPKNPNAASDTASARDAARPLGLELLVVEASAEHEFLPAFERFAAERCAAMLLAPDPLFISRRGQLVDLAARYKLPSMYEQATAEGLISYGTSLVEAHRQAGAYVGRILNGERPADLPVVQSTTFELIINLRAAKALGIEVPPSLLAQADQVVE